MAKQGMLSNGI